LALLLAAAGTSFSQEPAAKPSLAETLAALDPFVTSGEQRQELRQMLGRQLRGRIEKANRRSSEAWKSIETREKWEAFVNDTRPDKEPTEELQLKVDKIRILERDVERKELYLRTEVTGTIEGNGYQIQNLLYPSRPGLWVSANLYLPAEPRDSMPGILLSHSHHNPKEQGELQDMGMTWARAGCAVLVPDHLGHGERRQHPFNSAAEFDDQFAVGRQDYYFRYDTGMQLHLAGESLMEQFLGDLQRGVSVLLNQKGVDPDKIIILGAVAGGGDPAAYTAAFDERIDCVVPFNFGGPQPETRHPLPDDAETWFNYAGGGSWESTRNVSGSAASGALPWVVVGSVAPRKLIHAHEFSWDRERDPVWKRYEKIWGFYDAGDNLAFATGGGTIRVNNAEATHCNNIGAAHRKLIHEAFRKWFGIDVTPEKEYRQRRDPSELRCWTDEWRTTLQPKPLCQRLADDAVKQIAVTCQELDDESDPTQGRLMLLDTWNVHLLNGRDAFFPPKVEQVTIDRETAGDISLRRAMLTATDQMHVPVLLLLPPGKKDDVHPLVVAVAFDGKAAFLKQRNGDIAKLLDAGIAVCLADLRGCGETGDGDRGQYSAMTAHSSTELMLGGTMLGARVQDLRAVVEWVRGHFRVDPRRIALWGDSFTEPLAADATFKYPRRIDNRPPESDPMGSLVVLLAALGDKEIRAVYAHGGIVSYVSVLESPFVQLPHDCVVPGVFETGDLPELVAALSPRPVNLEGLVDGVNRIVTEDKIKATYVRATQRYDDEDASEKLTLQRERSSPAKWMIKQLKQW
jgi:cephalosporin-C deacetylase-like acetyl esterase